MFLFITRGEVVLETRSSPEELLAPEEAKASVRSCARVGKGCGGTVREVQVVDVIVGGGALFLL